MKRMYILLIAACFSLSLSAQTFISEDFSSGQMPPPGWNALPLGSQWSSSNTSNAGGVAPEAEYSNATGTTTARLLSPIIDLTNVDTVLLVFKHAYEGSWGSPDIGVATRGGSPWTIVWDKSPNGNIDPEEIQLILTGGDVGKPNFQFSFFVSGNMANLDAWYIDDVILKSPSGLDCKMTSISVPAVITGPEAVGGSVTNLGNTAVNEISISWQSFNGTVYDSTFTGLSLDLLETFDFDFDGSWISAFGYHDLTMWINTVNGVQDESQENDTLSKTIAYYANILPRKPCFEEFTSSTCGPCASFNSSFVPWSQQHADEIVLVKYQMNWPGSGDPYYTPEGGTRRNYYGVSYVPDLFCNGTQTNTSMGSVQSAFDNASELTSTLDIASSFTVNGTNIDITTNILPFSNYGEKRVFTIVVEKVTTGNVGSNGETEFHHVMMKMFPNGNGSTVDLQDRETATLTYNYDMSSTHVEEMADLLVVVIIQDYSSKEILQSAYGYEDANYSDEARLDMIMLDGEPLDEFDPDVYEYDVYLPEGTVEEPILSAETMDDAAFTVINQAFEIPGTSTVEVYAEDLFSTKLYTVNYRIATGTDEKPVPAVHVFPNPAQDKLYLTGITRADVQLFSSDGKLLMSKANFRSGPIDVSDLPRGIYILNIQAGDAHVVRKKVIIL